MHGLSIESIRKVSKGASRVRRGVSDIRICFTLRSSQMTLFLGRYSLNESPTPTPDTRRKLVVRVKVKVVRVFLNNITINDVINLNI